MKKHYSRKSKKSKKSKKSRKTRKSRINIGLGALGIGIASLGIYTLVNKRELFDEIYNTHSVNKRELFDELENLSILKEDEIYNICLVNEGIRPGFLTHYKEKDIKIDILNPILIKYNMKFVLKDNKHDITGKEYYVVKNDDDITHKNTSEILGFLCDENQFSLYNKNKANGYGVDICINDLQIITYVCSENITENNEKIQKITQTVKKINKYLQEIKQNDVKCCARIYKVLGYFGGQNLIKTIN